MLSTTAKSCQRPYRRTKGRRIHALSGWYRQRICTSRSAPEQQFIETLFGGELGFSHIRFVRTSKDTPY